MSSNQTTTTTAKLSKREQAWEEMFQGLVLYQAEHGDYNVPRNYKYNNKCLYDWIRKQKEGYRNSLKQPKLWPCLSSEKIERFHAIGFDLSVHGRYVQPAFAAVYQEQRKQHLQQQQQQQVPARSDTPSIEADRTQRSKVYSKHWDMMYHGLIRFQAQHGHLNVPKSTMVGTRSLALWVQGQRQYYRKYLHEANKPTPWQERVDRLRAIGFPLPATKQEGEEEVELLEDEEEQDNESPTEDNRGTFMETESKQQENNQQSTLPAIEPEPKRQKLQEAPDPAKEELGHEALLPCNAVVVASTEGPVSASALEDGAASPPTDPAAIHDALALLAGAATDH